MRLATHQDPWLASAFAGGEEEEGRLALLLRALLQERTRAIGAVECFLQVGGDHGYWREERLCRLADGRWLSSQDSHRSPQRGAPRPAGGTHRRRRAFGALLSEKAALHQTLPSPFVDAPRSFSWGIVCLWYRAESDEMVIFRGFREISEAFWRALPSEEEWEAEERARRRRALWRREGRCLLCGRPLPRWRRYLLGQRICAGACLVR